MEDNAEGRAEAIADPDVRLEEGGVFLNSEASTAELKKWAGDLARNTQDVVAVTILGEDNCRPGDGCDAIKKDQSIAEIA